MESSLDKLARENKDEVNNLKDLGEIDLYLYYKKSNENCNKLLKEKRKNNKRDLRILKLILLKDKLLNKHCVNHLESSVKYAEKLMKEDISNYIRLIKYSKLCTKDYSVIYEEQYFKFAQYCDEFSDLTFSLVKDIKKRLSNSSLVISIARVDADMKSLKIKNFYPRYTINSILNKGKKMKK